MAPAKKGDTVRVHYTGTLADGSVFDSSKERDPIAFEVGSGELLTAFDEAVVGMSKGDTKSFEIPAAEAYGDHNEDLVGHIERTQLPPDLNPEVGQQLESTNPDGEEVSVTVLDVSDEKIVVDANHPLAGEDLKFEIELVEVVGG